MFTVINTSLTHVEEPQFAVFRTAYLIRTGNTRSTARGYRCVCGPRPIYAGESTPHNDRLIEILKTTENSEVGVGIPGNFSGQRGGFVRVRVNSTQESAMKSPAKPFKLFSAVGILVLLVMGLAGQAFADTKPKYVYVTNSGDPNPGDQYVTF